MFFIILSFVICFVM